MGAYTLLQDLTVATNSTSVVLNDFGTITKDDFVKVVVTLVNASSSNNILQIFESSGNPNTQYHHQRLESSGTSVTATRGAFSFFGFASGSQTATVLGYLKISENDRLNTFSNSTRRNDSSIENSFFYNTSSGATFTNGITSLTFGSDRTDGIGTGSRIQIYKLAATKVADITVASNTTQVDISSLSIDKDSEYLLVQDIINGSGSANYLEFFVNNNTTSSAYYAQNIQGNGSSATAGRNNLADFIEISGSARSMVYSHIKLSNIGAYTSQNYGLRDYGASSPRLLNIFISSTSEAITSITQLNIKSFATNGIAAGSRFTLYKLYE